MPFLPGHSKDPVSMRKYGPALSLGTTMVGAVLGCTLVGLWLDHKFQTGERFTLGGLILGFLVSGYEVWKVVDQLQQEEQDREDLEQGGSK
jgi:F0F1-type ATP synthase assembly protein I